MTAGLTRVAIVQPQQSSALDALGVGDALKWPEDRE
jgi:hypothetical protein